MWLFGALDKFLFFLIFVLERTVLIRRSRVFSKIALGVKQTSLLHHATAIKYLASEQVPLQAVVCMPLVAIMAAPAFSQLQLCRATTKTP